MLDPARRKAANFSLWRRSAYILSIHFTVTLLEILILCPLRGDPLPPMIEIVKDVFLMQEGYDLLPFYVIMLALSPVVLEVFRRKLAWMLLPISLVVFTWGHYNEHYKIYSFEITNTFFLAFWQLMFLLGIFAGTALRWYTALPMRTKLFTAGGCWAMSVVIFFAAYGEHFNLPLHTPFTFWKNPLTFGEVLRYAALVGAIVTTTDLLWRYLDGSKVAAFVNRLGRRSLAMYISQIYLVGQIDRLGDYANWPWGTQPIFMALTVLILWCIAWTMDTVADLRKPARLPLSASQTVAAPVPS